MTDETFDRFYRDVHACFDKPEKAMAKSRCLEKCGHVPDEVMSWIRDRIESMERFPSNLPGAILTLWNTWRRENPHRCRAEQDCNPACQHCTDGWILLIVPVVRSGVQVYAEQATRCGYCGRMEAYPAFAHVRQEQIDRMNAVTGPRGIPTKEQRAFLAGRGEAVQEKPASEPRWNDVAKRAPEVAKTVKRDKDERERANDKHVRGHGYQNWEDMRAEA